MFISQPKSSKDSTLLQRWTNCSQNLRSTKLSDEIIPHERNKSSPRVKPVQEMYAQLHNYIDIIDRRVFGLLQTQSNQYKVVYQHYYKKFKDQLSDLKDKTNQQQKRSLHDDHVKYMDKQMKILKQETMLYKLSYEKCKKENQQLKRKVDTYKKDFQLMENSFKLNLRENKILRYKNQIFQDKSTLNSVKKQVQTVDENTKIITQHSAQKRSTSMGVDSSCQQKINFVTHKRSLSNVYQKFSEHKIPIYKGNDHINLDRNRQKVSFRSKISSQRKCKFHNTLSNNSANKLTSFKTQVQDKAQKQYQNFNICEWFMDCLKTVNRQIIHRKSKCDNFKRNFISSQFSYINSLQEFMKYDKLQMLKMFICDDKVVSLIYKMLKSQNIDENQQKQPETQCPQLQQALNGKVFREKSQPLKQKTENQSKLKINYSAFSGLSKKEQGEHTFHKTITQMVSSSQTRFNPRTFTSKQQKIQQSKILNKKQSNPRTQQTRPKYNQHLNQPSPQPIIIRPYHQQSSPLQTNNIYIKKLTASIKDKQNIQLPYQLFKRKNNISNE